MSIGDGVIQMACLGRPFRLGMLYDCRSDHLIPGLTLWNDEKLKSALDSSQQVGSDFEVIAEDSLHAKASQLNVSGSLKLSFLGGLVEVSGSAKYLQDCKSSEQQSRVSLKYWSTSRFDQLTMNQLGNIEYPKAFSDKIATHVVAGVLYGADAFFVFDRMVNENENVRNIDGEVEALIKRLPHLSNIKGHVELAISDKDKETASKIECKFHGDLQLPKNPTTFQDAVQVFQKLPQLLKDGDNPLVVPKKVWLYPLSKLSSNAAKLVHDISVGLISQAECVIEEFLKYDMHCNDLMKTKECSIFSGLHTQISNFKRMILQYRMDFSKRLASLLPSIREGGKEESQLADIFKSREASPFSSHSLKCWLEKKKNEIKVVAMYLASFRKVSCIQFALGTGDLNVIVNDLETKFVICFCFQMLTSDDPQLQQMQTFLTTQKFDGQLNKGQSWSKDEAIMAEMRKHVFQFKAFSEANRKHNGMKFVVTDASGKQADGATTIVLYRNGKQEVFDPPTPPGNIQEVGTTQQSITLKWSKPDCGSDSVQHYTVQYGCRLEKDVIDEWNETKTQGNETQITVCGLKPATPYCFKVCGECAIGSSMFSEVSDPIATREPDRLAEIIRAVSTLIKPPHGGSKGDDASGTLTSKPPPTYKVEGTLIPLNRKMLHKVSIGEEIKGAQEKVLMVLGATGAGKSTLINGMINYMFGVQWKDNFRFKLITEEAKSQAHSQTSTITAYTIYHMDGSQVEYNLTIIDTPGFGDTSGLERDKEITEQIKQFFSVQGQNGISHLNGIGFVTQSALARLTPTQQYIFDSILSIFGKDVAKNIFIMVTFADGQKPPVMSAIEAAKIPQSGFFKFNNSALFAEISDDDEDNFDEMFWRMGVSSFKKFFAAFQKAESVSLTMTKEVLQYRENLETVVIGLQRQMKECLAEMEVLRQEKEVLKEHEKDIETNKDFTFYVDVPFYRTEKCPKDTFVTNCLRCSTTCHYPCGIPDNEDKMWCAAMNRKGSNSNCSVCDGGCDWSDHKNTGERFILDYKKEKKTSDDLKKKYDSAAEGKTAVQKLLDSHQHKLLRAHAKLHEMIDEAQQCLVKLDEIALKPNPLTQVEYIKLLINSEKQQAKKGYMDRVKYLEMTKEQVEWLAIMKDAKDAEKRIVEAKQKKEPGWEKKVETLEQVKRIKHEVEAIKEERKSHGRGAWGVITGTMTAARNAVKATGKAIISSGKAILYGE